MDDEPTTPTEAQQDRKVCWSVLASVSDYRTWRRTLALPDPERVWVTPDLWDTFDRWMQSTTTIPTPGKGEATMFGIPVTVLSEGEQPPSAAWKVNDHGAWVDRLPHEQEDHRG